MNPIFLSYSWVDRDFAEFVDTRLTSAGFDVLRDTRDVAATDVIAKRVAGLIDRSECVLAIMSPSAVRSPWCDYEIGLSLHKRIAVGRPEIVPVMKDDCEIPFHIAHLLRVDFRHEREAPLRNLIRTLRQQSLTDHQRSFDWCALENDELSELSKELQTSFPRNLAKIFWSQLQTSAPLAERERGNESQWPQLIQQANAVGRLGSLLRLLQPLDVSCIHRLRGRRAQRIIRPGAPPAKMSIHRADVDRLASLFREIDPATPLEDVDTATSYNVAVVGGFSAGKSTIINALLERELLPEHNQVSTPCPTFVRRSSDGDERATATLLSAAELSHAILTMLSKAGIMSPEVEDLLSSANWEELYGSMHRLRDAGGDGRAVRGLWDDLLIPVCRSAMVHHELLGLSLEVPVDNLRALRVCEGNDGGIQPLLKRIDVFVNVESMPGDLALVDTPGVTSQNPWHKDFAFQIVEQSHALMIVEPYDAPMGKGPDELMDAFYSKLVHARRDMQSVELDPDFEFTATTSKVFVVLNKCDLSMLDRSKKPAVVVQETLEALRRRYTSAWGVAPNRFFAVSGLTTLDELRSTGEGNFLCDVDTHMLEFRKLRSALYRYLTNELASRSDVARLDVISGQLEALRQQTLVRMEGLSTDATTRQGFLEHYQSSVSSLERIRSDAEAQLRSGQTHDPQAIKPSLSATLRQLLDETAEEVREIWEGYVADKHLFLPWIRAVLREEMTRKCAAALATWGGETVARLVWHSANEIEVNVQARLSAVYEEFFKAGMPQEGQLTPPRTVPQLDSKELPGLEDLRGLWDKASVRLVPMTPLTNPVQATRDWLRKFVLVVEDQIVKALPDLIGKLGKGLARLSIGRVDALISRLSMAINEARQDAETSAAGSAEQRRVLGADLEKLTRLGHQIETTRGKIVAG